MTNEIPKTEWAEFFDGITKRRFEWETKVEVIGTEIGSQILDQGLPLIGLTYENGNGEPVIEIMVGFETNHQTHNVRNPTKVAYLGAENSVSGIVEIEEADQTKTLVHIIQPQQLVVKHFANVAGT